MTNTLNRSYFSFSFPFFSESTSRVLTSNGHIPSSLELLFVGRSICFFSFLLSLSSQNPSNQLSIFSPTSRFSLLFSSLLTIQFLGLTAGVIPKLKTSHPFAGARFSVAKSCITLAQPTQPPRLTLLSHVLRAPH